MVDTAFTQINLIRSTLPSAQSLVIGWMFSGLLADGIRINHGKEAHHAEEVYRDVD